MAQHAVPFLTQHQRGRVSRFACGVIHYNFLVQFIMQSQNLLMYPNLSTHFMVVPLNRNASKQKLSDSFSCFSQVG